MVRESGSSANGKGGGESRSESNGPGRSGGNGADRAIPIDWEGLARATAHPLRISVLEVLSRGGGRVLSPVELSRELELPLSNTNYHVRELAKTGMIEPAGQRPVRGATEHFYRLRGHSGQRPEARAGWPLIADS